MKLNIILFLTILIPYVKPSELFKKTGRDFLFHSQKNSKQGLKDTFDTKNDESKYKHTDKKSLKDAKSVLNNGSYF
jgi:hypothetical protein